MILASRILPTYIEPSVSINCPEAGSYEVGTSITPTFRATFNEGSYQYNQGESTGITISNWSATFNEKTINSDSGIFDAITLEDNFNKRIGIIATHSAASAEVIKREPSTLSTLLAKASTNPEISSISILFNNNLPFSSIVNLEVSTF